MKRRTLYIFILLALISILGIVITQVYWFKKAYENSEQEFDKNVTIALKEVVKGILKYNNISTLPVDPVQQITPNYYAVMVNDRINADVLEHYLQTELKKFNIRQGFEYSIYDCANKQMVYGGYLDEEQSDLFAEKHNLPKWKEDNYYFTVYFPHKAGGIIGEMTVWVYLSGIILVVVVFFSYSLFVILKQKRLSEIQRDFINNMAHEIRTPLSTITISAQTLKNPDIIHTPQRLLNYATIIMDEAVKLKNQVERVLSIADSESKMKINPELIHMNGLIEQVSSQLVSNSDKKVSFQFVAHAKQDTVYGDKLHLGNLISNLVDNSLKYSYEEVNITITTRNPAQNTIEIQVTDNGVGISKENQKKIFDKFYRVPTGNVHNAKGFGIGLNYVVLITKAHKGTITVQSEQKAGTTFTITLPTV